MTRRDQSTKGTQIDGAGPVLPDSLAGPGASMGGIHPGLKVALAILAAIFWLAAGQVVPNDRLLSMTIDVSKRVIPKGQSISINGKLTNLSSRYLLINGGNITDTSDLRVYIFSPDQSLFSIRVTDPSGMVTLIRTQYQPPYVPNSVFTLLKPGVSIALYGNPGDREYHFDQTGQYFIKVCYSNGYNPGESQEYSFWNIWERCPRGLRCKIIDFQVKGPFLDLRQAWKGEICSNEVQVEVVP